MNTTVEKAGNSGQNNFFGPIERWMFEQGTAYDLRVLHLDISNHLTCLAEFEDGVDISLHDQPDSFYSHDTLADKDGVKFRFQVPELWRDDQFGEPAFRPHFIPFLLKSPRDFRPTNHKEVETVLSEFIGKSGKPADPDEHRSKGFEDQLSGAYFRANYPLLPGTVVESPIKREKSGKHTPGNNPKKIVIAAIIDDGIPFAHRSFQTEGQGTRVDYCWSQSAVAQETDTVLFGREFTKDWIDGCFKETSGNEDLVYERAGLLYHQQVTREQAGRFYHNDGFALPLSRMISHGAHVLDTMAGRRGSDDDAEIRVIAVDLPATATWDTSGFGKDMYIVSALHYIFERADRLAIENGMNEPAPLVINLSYGISGGPHDGGNIVEAAIDEMVKKRRDRAPTAVVLPSGNQFSSNLHTVVTGRHFEEDHNTAAVDWILQPNDQTSSFLEIWVPDGMSAKALKVAIQPPGRKRTKFATTDNLIDPVNVKVNDEVICAVSAEEYRNDRTRFLIAVAPTEPRPDSDRPAAPSGLWKIFIKFTKGKNDGREIPSSGVEMWINRDDAYGQGKTGARQSYFLDDRDVPYWGTGRLNQKDRVSSGVKLRRFGAINGLATGQTTIVVSGYDKTTGLATIYSGAGALRRTNGAVSQTVPDRTQVDISAVTENGAWSPGIVGAGTRSGITVSLSGTSVAAPQISRALLRLFLERDAKKLLKGNPKNYIDQIPVLHMDRTTIAETATEVGDTDKTERLGRYKLKPIDQIEEDL